MKIAEAKLRFDAGQLKSAVVHQGVMRNKYVLEVTGKNDYSGRAIERQRGGIAAYKTIDAAVAAAKRIGFRKITVELC